MTAMIVTIAVICQHREGRLTAPAQQHESPNRQWDQRVRRMVIEQAGHPHA
jgi:hypothetical protein